MDKKYYVEPTVDVYDVYAELPILAASGDIDDETGEAPINLGEI